MNRLPLSGLAAVVLVLCASIIVGAEKAPVPKQDKAKEERQDKAKAVARAWFEASVNRDVVKVLSLSTTPFSWEGREIAETTEELEAKIKKAFDEDDGKSDRPEIKDISVEDDKKTTTNRCVPNNWVLVKITLEQGTAFFVCVVPGKDYRVAGIGE